MGNGFFPLIEHLGYPRLRVNCCDLSKTAIALIKKHEKYNEEYVKAFQCDVVNDPIPFEANTADFCLFLFVLSGISPDKHLPVMQKLSDQMKSGGVIYFRDYGRYDMAQLRFAKRGNQKLADNFYVRHDKTRAYYFTLEEIEDLFKKVGFEVIENKYHYRMVENRKEQLRMYRVWIQCRMRKI